MDPISLYGANEMEKEKNKEEKKTKIKNVCSSSLKQRHYRDFFSLFIHASCRFSPRVLAKICNKQNRRRSLSALVFASPDFCNFIKETLVTAFFLSTRQDELEKFT